MADQLTNEQIAEFKFAFMFLDKNHDGEIETNELGTAMRMLGQNPSEADLKEMIAHVDTDRSGRIDFEDFMLLMHRKLSSTKDTEEMLKRAFDKFDSRGEGYVGTADLRNKLTTIGEKLTDEEFDELMKYADVDGDGSINVEELCKLLITQQPVLSGGGASAPSSAAATGYRAF